jgi:hypothetical protein
VRGREFHPWKLAHRIHIISPQIAGSFGSDKLLPHHRKGGWLHFREREDESHPFAPKVCGPGDCESCCRQGPHARFSVGFRIGRDIFIGFFSSLIA